MVREADAFAAFWDSESSGTASAIDMARGNHDRFDVGPLPDDYVAVEEYR